MSIPKPEFPLPQRERQNWLNLNGEWEFALFPQGKEEDEARFAARCEAYDRAITVPFSWTCPLSGVQEDVPGVGWYRRRVEFPADGRVFLCFGAVDYIADVYVNGVHAVRHQGGYTQFEAEVSDCWQPGENTVEVRSEDYRRETQLYGKQGYGEIQGIWQSVWLEARPQSYIQSFRLTTRCCGEVAISAEVCAPDGAVLLARFAGLEALGIVKEGRAEASLNIPSPRLWSPEDPHLYEGELALGDDIVKTYFGIREIAAGILPGKLTPCILLNSKPIYVNGALDQAFNPRGHFTYPSDMDMRDEVWRVKRLGLNMARIHIKPEEPRKLYWMDRLGVLVMADVPCFWGEPNEAARAAYEREWPDILLRDINHPCIFAWVMFNESWGLLHKAGEEKEYRIETRDWVASVQRRAKALDPTRLVEDNSPCRCDHVRSDINTWHFYINGYEQVRDHIREVAAQTYPGSTFNYIGGCAQTGAPLMNSECGMVWGVDNSAGDSDLAWQYHYMLNEYRLHEKVCGFVFTELHDVVNEFNGYYRIDHRDKDFGYGHFCRGMSLKDMHAADFVAVDCPPCRTIAGGEEALIPLALSSFTDAHHAEGLSIFWELWHEGFNGKVLDDRGEARIAPFGYGVTQLEPLNLTMPRDDAVAVLSLYLEDAQGRIISRNFTTFDVRAQSIRNCLELPVSAGRAEGFEPVWTALEGEKLCLGGTGEVRYLAVLPEGLAPDSLTILMEAGAKRVLKKDRKEIGDPEQDLGFMRGYLVDRGAFENSYPMTDEERFPSQAQVLIDGEPIGHIWLENDWADSRGVLSWHAQPNHRRLDEAGSYGELKRISVPSRLLPGIVKRGEFELGFRVSGQGGLALYGRHCGRYPLGLRVCWD